MSAPEIVIDLLVRSSGVTYNDSIGKAWYDLTRRQITKRNKQRPLVGDYYDAFLEDLGSGVAWSALARDLGQLLEETRQAKVAQTQSPFLNDDSYRDLFDQAPGLLKQNKGDQEAFKKINKDAEEIVGEKNSIARWQDLNQDLALAFYFMKWLEYQADIKKGSFEDAQEAGTEDKYAEDILKEIKDNIEIRNSVLPPESVDQVFERALATKLVSSNKFDKQRYLIQRIDELSKLSAQRFLYKPGVLGSQDLVPEKETFENEQWLGLPQTKILRFTNSQKNGVGKISGTALGREMFKLSNEDLSKLVPKIRIFKIKYDENMNKTSEVEIKFPTTNNPDAATIFDANPDFNKSIGNPSVFRKTRRDYGIRSFSWQYDGNDPFSVDRDIGATLELYFQDFSQFTAIRGKDKTSAYRYLDLIAPIDEEFAGQKDRLGELFKKDIRIEAGWEVPNTFSQAKQESIKASQVNFVLTPMDYNISFAGNGNGSCTVSINYRARIESMGKSRLINVIAAEATELAELQRFQVVIENKNFSEEVREKARKEQEEIYKEVRSKASKRFIDRLMDNGSVYWRNVDLKEILISTLGDTAARRTYEALYEDEFDFPPPTHLDGLEESLKEIEATNVGSGVQTIPLEDLPLVRDIDLENALDEKEKIKGPEKIAYTFFGDIIQNAIEIAIESGNFLGAPVDALKEMKVVMMDFRVGEKGDYNISDIPIEMGLLMEYMQNEIGKKNEQTMPIIRFINGILSEVITNRIENYLNLKDGTSRSFKVGYNSQNKNLQSANLREFDLNNRKHLAEILKNPQVDQLVVYTDSPILSDFKIEKGQYVIKKRQDEAEGLHHFALGSTRSLVKNISFDRVDLEYARERRLTINDQDPYALLANVFNVNIQMFGNNFFKPGSYIYVDPKVMGDLGAPYIPGTVANTMGLGGYHIVTKVQSTISENSYSTTIDAVWETSGAGEFLRTASGQEESE
jgi:hypothetical protein